MFILKYRDSPDFGTVSIFVTVMYIYLYCGTDLVIFVHVDDGEQVLNFSGGHASIVPDRGEVLETGESIKIISGILGLLSECV